MSLADGYTDLPPGKLANVVTCLEMRERADPRPERVSPALTIEAFTQPDARRYRALVRHVGEPYLWQSPLLITDEQFAEQVRDPKVAIYALLTGGRDEGILHLDFRQAGECEVRLFGVSERLRGTGAGRKLMNYALDAAWSRPIRRLWLHTCTLDHPDALPFYIRSGFAPFKRQVEIHDDPRTLGLYPKTAAPNVPLI
ncbi:MAG TPA: GNAT family N-acetyltransferase [Candidatus Baltobacteraceae bacterium]|nr:GNAT family N-acetyltransferase [Candidatus Baltobacteraceae bacterium]